MRQIQVTVGCTVYNHEKYLRKCLEGFVSQKTNFSYEVIVHDDASTDDSARIIKEFEKKYPEIIKPIYQTENQFSKGILITKEYILPKAQGKYFAFCEGDDFWCDDNKLQKQYDAMEAHPECRLCLHSVRGVSEDEKNTIKMYPPFPVQEGVIDQKQFYEIIGRTYAFQTSCYFRWTEDVIKFLNDPPLFKKVAGVGDVPILLYSGTLGNVYYIDCEMSCYRMNSDGSWSSRIKSDEKKFLQHFENMVLMYDEFNKYSNMKYMKELMHARRYNYLDACLLKKDDRACARILSKRENLDFMKRLGITCYIGVLLRAYVPGLAKVLYNLKGIKR